MTLSLSDHLHGCLRDKAGIGAWSGAHKEMRAAIGRDPDLRAEAETRLAELSEAVTAKCFISRSHRDALLEALRDG